MDTNEAADRLGTTPRVLRAFLRSPVSTFQAVGSGSRYEFDEKEIPTLERRFSDWKSAGKPKADNGKRKKSSKPKPSRAEVQATKDKEVWDEEGPAPKLEDIRNPRVRARVKADAAAAEERLMLLLISKNLHITQLGDRKTA